MMMNSSQPSLLALVKRFPYNAAGGNLVYFKKKAATKICR